MMQQIVKTPPILHGSDASKLSQLHNYLFEISRQLNTALTNLDTGNFSSKSPIAKAAAGEFTDAQGKAISANTAALKSLIIKTADIVRTEMDNIETQLRSEYVAASDFGTYKQDTDATISANAEKIAQTISTSVELRSEINGLQSYKSDTLGYIQQGVIGYESDGITPIIGIAIGRDLKIDGTAIGDDGKTYNVIRRDNLSTWTTEELSFYVNGAKVASFSSEALSVYAIRIGSWLINTSGGLSFRWSPLEG